MIRCTFVLLLCIWGCFTATRQQACDPRLPHCRGQSSQQGRRQDCKPLWLIPGKATDCSKPQSKKLIQIDPNSVSISPNPIRIPGCFNIAMRVRITDGRIPNNYFAKVEYHWNNFPLFTSMPCQNSSSNGCGGYGNNCYYCDVCSNLREVDRTSSRSNMVNQFKGIKCPDRAGVYDLKKQFCFNDWNEVDKDNDCKIDALENGQVGQNYSDVLTKLSRNGGTILAKFILAHNATGQQAQMKAKKEGDMDAAIGVQLEKKRKENHWAVTSNEFRSFAYWYRQNRKAVWHKDKYMPWLLYVNEIGCLGVIFNVCTQKPVAATSGPDAYRCG